MMFPPRYSHRTRELLALERVLDGTLYDHIHHPFFRSCDTDGTYIPINRRRPSVRSNLCNVVVDDSVSLLFGASHWPSVTVHGADEQAKNTIRQIVKAMNLSSLMEQAAVMGSVG
ncbi:portal protein, partial [Acetobacter estunensis]|nr:portal protein [Acetobacter estunensis]